MICEMCGKDAPSTRYVSVEGSRLNVCPNCAKFGDDHRVRQSKSSSVFVSNSQIIDQRLQKRQQRMRVKDVYRESETIQLVNDYGGVIRKARMAKGIDIEQFAASILEKKGILAKIEANDLVPDDKLVKKLEKVLNIKLTEVVSSKGSIIYNQSARMSLGDFIKKE